MEENEIPHVWAECGSCNAKGWVGANTIDGTISKGDNGLWDVTDLCCMECGEMEDVFVQSLDERVEWEGQGA